MVEYGGDVNSGNVPGQRGHACEGCWCIDQVGRDRLRLDHVKKMVGNLDMGGERFDKGLEVGVDVSKTCLVGNP